MRDDDVRDLYLSIRKDPDAKNRLVRRFADKTGVAEEDIRWSLTMYHLERERKRRNIRNAFMRGDSSVAIAKEMKVSHEEVMDAIREVRNDPGVRLRRVMARGRGKEFRDLRASILDAVEDYGWWDVRHDGEGFLFRVAVRLEAPACLRIQALFGGVAHGNVLWLSSPPRIAEMFRFIGPVARDPRIEKVGVLAGMCSTGKGFSRRAEVLIESIRSHPVS